MTRSVEIPEAAVEVAAETWARAASGWMWGQYTAATRRLLIDNAKPTARASLEAAVPLIPTPKYIDSEDDIIERAPAALPYLAPAGPVSRELVEQRIRRVYLDGGASIPVAQEGASDIADALTDLLFAPAGDGGLREALKELAQERDAVGGHVGADYTIRPYELLDLLKAHPAAPAVPQPVDREALARWLYEHYDPRGNGTGQHWPWDELSQQTKDQYGQQADAVLAVVAGEQEQVEK